jgi:site-specific recombinase XerD
MANDLNQVTTVTVFVRHSKECEKENGKLDRNHRGCRCRKWLYIYEGGQGRRVTAKTKSWKEAERAALAERIRLDPVEAEKRRIAGQVEASAETIEDALGQWFGGFKWQTQSTSKVYRSFIKKVVRWAEKNGITRLQDVTPDHLDKWRSEWGLDAACQDDKLNPTTQKQTQGRLKAFFKWGTDLRKIPWNPASSMGRIVSDPEETMPLTLVQFDELLAATYAYDKGTRRDYDKFGAELRAIFLVQRWVGLRIIDVLLLPRTAVVNGVLSLKTLKTGAEVVIELPRVVLEALAALKPGHGASVKHYFWSGACTVESLRATWLRRIRALNNKYLSFLDEEGKPMRFHSHMLRDTFAVQLLLAGCPLEEVSRLLTHESIKVTEKHYSKWVTARKLQLREHHKGYMVAMGGTF